jgi:galactose mutarotase-like enzyme
MSRADKIIAENKLFGGLCLECQGYSDGDNIPELVDVIVRTGGTYQQITIYRFTGHEIQTCSTSLGR